MKAGYGASRTWSKAPPASEVAASGVVTDRDATRILAAGDSYFAGDELVDNEVNHDFAGYAANWLVDCPQLAEGFGPRPVNQCPIATTLHSCKSSNGCCLPICCCASIWSKKKWPAHN